jgi:hypothetical protein
LPVVCRNCGQITVGGLIIPMPVELESAAQSLAEAAVAAGASSLEALTGDPGKQISTYFAEHYKRAYLDGFFRAVAFYRHEAKQGRLIRLRELWATTSAKEQPVTVGDPGMGGNGWGTEQRTFVEMRPEVYAEIDALLKLGAHGADDVQGPENEDPPLPPGDARMPR